jgi:hypothetical protein
LSLTLCTEQPDPPAKVSTLRDPSLRSSRSRLQIALHPGRTLCAAGVLVAAIALALVAAVTISRVVGHSSSFGFAQDKTQAASATASTVVSVIPSRPTDDFAPGAVGLSVEADELDNRDLSSGNRSLVALMRGLGPGVLRVGGNSVDYSAWSSANETAPNWAKSVISPADLVQLDSLLRATGWQVILGVDLGHFDPNRAADEARAAVDIFGSRLLGVEVGNEPNNYASPMIRLRASSYSVDDYLGELAAYSAAIRASAPTVRLYGPDLASRGLEAWLLAVASNSVVSFAAITEHYYPTKYNVGKGDCEGTGVPTATQLLSPEVREKENMALQILVRAGQLARRQIRISETNTTASCDAAGGPRTSPVFASALWALDWVLRSASAGVTGLNFHGYYGRCLPEGVAPICAADSTADAHTQVVARPEYYGLLAAKELEGGWFVPVDVRAGSAQDDLTGYATIHPNGLITVAILNFTVDGRTRVLVKVPGYHRATSESLLGRSISATGGVTFGGATINPSGILRPRRTPVASSAGAFSLDLPSRSAVVVTLHR